MYIVTKFLLVLVFLLHFLDADFSNCFFCCVVFLVVFAAIFQKIYPTSS